MEADDYHGSLPGERKAVPQRDAPKVGSKLLDDHPAVPVRCPIAAIEDVDERLWQLRLFCTPLLLAVEDDTHHFKRLDQQLFQLLITHSTPLYSEGPQKSFDDFGGDKRAANLVERLPSTPQRRFALPLNNGLMRSKGITVWDSITNARWSQRYVVPNARTIFAQQAGDDAESSLSLLEKIQDSAWDNLYVTKLIDVNTLRLAAAFEKQPPYDIELARTSYAYVNLLAELIDEFQAISDTAGFGIQEPFEDPSDEMRALKQALFPDDGEEHEQARSIIKVFLWAAWQRSMMLHFHYVIGAQLQQGYSSEWNVLLAVSGVHDLSSMLEDNVRGTGAEYMCNWAFQVLRTSRTSVGLDFRHMIDKFDSHFQGRDGRCIDQSSEPCTGGDPGSCHRFTAAETAAQSAHASDCSRGCKRIIWHESSYMSCPRPAAVRADPSSTQLDYNEVSARTLAISHVWSHGQGGRPESGINTCLHKRYCALAKQFHCDTYWIDSACIPTKHTLRRAAIAQISQIFATAGIVLVIDTDVQDVGIQGTEISLEEIETIVSILLVCDWNVRGWTMLEGIRGSGSIFLLCKGDRTANLRDILIRLHQEGAVDLAALLGCAQHLIPHANPRTSKSIEEAGFLLSQRHTSWPEDVIICWSLLMNIAPTRIVADLWISQSQVRTSFLLSSSPRIQDQLGLSWAPATPYIRPIQRSVELEDGSKQHYNIRFPPYDGSGSQYAAITPRGLQGKWRIMEVDNALLDVEEEICCHQWPDIQYEHPDEASAWLLMHSLLSQGAQVRILRALAEDGTSAYSGSSQRGEMFGLLAAVCASGDGAQTWQWHGVYSWQQSENHENWEVADMVIV